MHLLQLDARGNKASEFKLSCLLMVNNSTNKSVNLGSFVDIQEDIRINPVITTCIFLL